MALDQNVIFLGWFETEQDVEDYIKKSNNRTTIDITGLSEQEAIAKIHDLFYKKKWITELADNYAEKNNDEDLCYYVGFDETQDADIKPMLRDAVYYGASETVKELLKLVDRNMDDNTVRQIKSLIEIKLGIQV